MICSHCGALVKNRIPDPDQISIEGMWEANPLPILEKQERGQEPPPCGEMSVTDGGDPEC